MCFRGGGRKSYVFRVFLTNPLRSAAQCVLRGRPDKGGGCQSLERTKNKAVEVSSRPMCAQCFSNKAVEVSPMCVQGTGALSDKGAGCHASSLLLGPE